MNDEILRDILRRLKALEQTAVRYRAGEVTGTGPLDVALGGSDVSYEDVRALDHAALATGDQIASLLWGNDLLVLDALGDGGAHKVAFPFAAGWSNSGGANEGASYSKIGRMVKLQGLVTKATTPVAFDVIGTLPVGFRPVDQLIFPAATGSTPTAGVVGVSAAGVVFWWSGNTTATNFTSLSGIAFVVD